MQVVTLSFFRFGALARLWAFAQMGLARRPLRRLEGAEFVKLMGAGTGEGFTPIPDTGSVAVLVVWRDRAAAEAGHRAPVFRRYHARAAEALTLTLAPISSWGAWSGVAPFRPEGQARGPIAALTRATLRLRALPRFWGRVPAISRRIGRDPNVQFKAGVGEVPWLHQVTFSIWPDTESMAAFARTNGAHAAAIQAVRDGDWFAEELYARFDVLAAEGAWRGQSVTLDAPALAAE